MSYCTYRDNNLTKIEYGLIITALYVLYSAQTVDKVGAGNYPQHHFSINTG